MNFVYWGSALHCETCLYVHTHTHIIFLPKFQQVDNIFT